MPGYKVVKQEMEFHDIYVRGDWASAWATERQTVQPPGGKPPIESYGKMALGAASRGERRVAGQTGDVECSSETLRIFQGTREIRRASG